MLDTNSSDQSFDWLTTTMSIIIDYQISNEGFLLRWCRGQEKALSTAIDCTTSSLIMLIFFFPVVDGSLNATIYHLIKKPKCVPNFFSINKS